MGIDANIAAWLVAARKAGVDYTRTLTIGRQTIFGGDGAAFRHLRILPPDNPSAGGLFRNLGATVTDSLDASDYEGATIIHDLNQPLPLALHGQYTAVFDGGSLEHIFDLARAITSCMALVSPGGHLLIASPANQYLGHGFYQFSPELFFRVLSPMNGYTMCSVVMFDRFLGGTRWYRLRDPAALRRRVELRTYRRTEVLAVARRMTETLPATVTAQQSDFQTLWDASADAGPPEEEVLGWKGRIGRAVLPARVFNRLRAGYWRLLMHRSSCLPGARPAAERLAGPQSAFEELAESGPP